MTNFFNGINHQTKIQFVKYLIVGLLNFCSSLVIYYFLLKVVFLHYLVGLTIAWIWGILLTYFINFTWVFKPEDKIAFNHRLWKYIAVYATSYALNLVLLKLIIGAWDIDPFIGQFIILPLVVIINFTGFKYWSLK